MGRKYSQLLLVAVGLLALMLFAAACGSPEGNGDPGPTPTDNGDDPGQDGDELFAGQTIRIIIPYSPGGSSSVLVPFFAHELPNYLPGNPRMVSSHITPVISAYNFVSGAPGDGLTMMYSSAVPIADQYSDEAEFEAAGFHYVGAYETRSDVFFVTSDVPYDSFAEGQGSDFDLRMPVQPNPLEITPSRLGFLMLADEWDINLTALPLSGAAAGTPELLTAMERGDIHGFSSSAIYYSLPNVRPGWFSDGFAKPLGFIGAAGEEMVPNVETDATVENLTDRVIAGEVSDQAREHWEAFVTSNIIAKHFILPPDTPDHIVEAFRTAFADAMADETFVTTLERLLGQETQVILGEETQSIVEDAAASFAERQDEYEPLVNRLYDRFAP